MCAKKQAVPTAEEIAAKAARQEIEQHIERHKLDQEAWHQVHRHKDVSSVNWGIKTSHLWTRYNREMESDCDTYTLCGKLLPDRERRFVRISKHPDGDQAENFCSKCLALIEPYRITREILNDERWWSALDKMKAGRPYNHEPPYRIPAQRPLTQKLKKIYSLCCAGTKFSKGAYEMTWGRGLDGAPLQTVQFMGVKAWTDKRVKCEDKDTYFIVRLVIEPVAAHVDRDYLRVAEALAWHGKVSIDHRGAEVYTQTGKHKWQKNCACVLSRNAEAEEFRISFEPRAAEAIDASRSQALPAIDSGDPNHPAYPLAVKINEAARRCLEQRGRVIAMGEERRPFKFIAAKASNRQPDAVRFEYRAGGMKCSTLVAMGRLRNLDRALARGHLEVFDEDCEPFVLAFIGGPGPQMGA